MAILTYRRDQVTYKPGMPCANQLIGGIIFCGSKVGQQAWIDRLFRTGKFNYFVKFNDVQSPYALQFGFSEWVVPGCKYIIH
jgi:hypothetical protein